MENTLPSKPTIILSEDQQNQLNNIQNLMKDLFAREDDILQKLKDKDGR